MAINSEFRGAQAVIDLNEVKDILEWHYGSLVKTKDSYDGSIQYFIEDETGESWFVNEDTIGRFTGICDIHGKKIYEGDILSERPNESSLAYIGIALYDEELTAFVFQIGKVRKATLGSYSKSYTVIGNIHENPEIAERIRK